MPQSIAELKALNEKNGGCWFGRGEMRFFGTKIESGILRGHYFISANSHHGPRAYTVRSFNDEGDVEAVGDFLQPPPQQSGREVGGTPRNTLEEQTRLLATTL